MAHTTTACYICGSEPHEPTALHVYTSEADVAEWEASLQYASFMWAPEADETLRFPGED